jgi:hypothetical protein
VDIPLAGKLSPGHPLRPAHPAQVARVHVRRRLRARGRHRRQHRHLQSRGRDPLEGAALSRTRPPGAAVGKRPADACRAPRRLVSRLSRLARGVEELRRHRGPGYPVDDVCRQRRTGADPDRVRRGAVFFIAWRVAPPAVVSSTPPRTSSPSPRRWSS